MLERGENLEQLLDQTESLSQAAVQFHRTGTQIRRQMWYQDMKLVLCTVLVLVAILYLFISSICEFPAWHNCFPH